jgi:hypothetical protein
MHSDISPVRVWALLRAFVARLQTLPIARHGVVLPRKATSSHSQTNRPRRLRGKHCEIIAWIYAGQGHNRECCCGPVLDIGWDCEGRIHEVGPGNHREDGYASPAPISHGHAMRGDGSLTTQLFHTLCSASVLLARPPPKAVGWPGRQAPVQSLHSNAFLSGHSSPTACPLR